MMARFALLALPLLIAGCDQQMANQPRYEPYDFFASPCHGVGGDGDGLVVRRGSPRPPSFHQDALRRARDRHFYDVITQGYGAMYSYADRVPPADRWAIVAYIRALQVSQ